MLSLTTRSWPPLRGCWVLAALVGVAACGATPRYQAGIYRRGSLGFRVGELPSGWQRTRAVHGASDGVTFHHAGGGTVHAGGDCDHPEDVPLDVLSNHLLIGFEDRKEVSRDPLVLDGRGALRTRVDARLDGVSVVLDVVVTRKDGCTYDLQLITGPAVYQERRPDFDRFVGGFAQAAP